MGENCLQALESKDKDKDKEKNKNKDKNKDEDPLILKSQQVLVCSSICWFPHWVNLNLFHILTFLQFHRKWEIWLKSLSSQKLQSSNFV